MTRADKKDYVEKLADEAEEAAGRNDLKTLYKINKQLNNGFKNCDVPVKNKNGMVIEKEAEKTTALEGTFRVSSKQTGHPSPSRHPTGRYRP